MVRMCSTDCEFFRWWISVLGKDPSVSTLFWWAWGSTLENLALFERLTRMFMELVSMMLMELLSVLSISGFRVASSWNETLFTLRLFPARLPSCFRMSSSVSMLHFYSNQAGGIAILRSFGPTFYSADAVPEGVRLLRRDFWAEVAVSSGVYCNCAVLLFADNGDYSSILLKVQANFRDSALAPGVILATDGVSLR